MENVVPKPLLGTALASHGSAVATGRGLVALDCTTTTTEATLLMTWDTFKNLILQGFC